ncbi:MULTISPECIES: hypothetical protein [unclassified Microbacterium]|uniref:hypothetical protein n=1 Tax=unclassified Microbacterium TaxID=2609290 RepID=UPI00301A7CE8
MNHYGQRIRAHWETYRPEELAALEDPERFFTEAGEELSTTIATLSAQMAGPDLPGEQYLEKVARLRNAQATATEIAWAQSGLLQVEASREEWESDTQQTLLGLQEWAWRMQAQLEGLEQTTFSFEETAAEYLLPVPFLKALVAATSPYEFLNESENRAVWEGSVEARWAAFQGR